MFHRVALAVDEYIINEVQLSVKNVLIEIQC